MSVFESTWKPNLDRQGAIDICAEAIKAGIFNDLGSGSNVDVAVITGEKTTLLRNYIKPNERERKARDYKFRRGTTAVLNEKVITREEISKYVTVHELEDDNVAAAAERMDVDA